MKHVKSLPLVLAALIQFAPISRVLLPAARFAGPLAAWVRMAAAFTVSLGALHAQSGASSVTITSSTSATGTVGKAFSYTVRTRYEVGDVTWVPASSQDRLPPGLAPTVGSPFIRGTPTEAGVFNVIVTAYEFRLSSGLGNSNPTASAKLTITVSGATVAVSIVTQPNDVTVTEGDTTTLTVGATGSPLQFQWYSGTQAISGQTSSNLTLANITPAQAGVYHVTVGNTLGTLTSRDATVTVNPKIVAPLITTQPTSLTVNEGDPAKFTLIATGTDPLTYQWFLGTNLLVGETLPTLSILSSGLTNAGSYTVTVSNLAGQISSLPALLTVIPKTVVVPTFTNSSPNLSFDFIQFEFPVQARVAYVVEATTNLELTNSWTVITNVPAQAALSNAIISVPTTGASSFFRSRSLP
jgi:hypothetical protein